MTLDPQALAAARDGASVTKAKILNFISALGEAKDVEHPIKIFAFEGDDDLVVWNVWIERCSFGHAYEPFICQGKREARVLSHVCARDAGDIRDRVWIFVDRDFDGTLNFANLDRVFATCRYSIENYFVSRDVFSKILAEVFPLNGKPAIRANLEAGYQEALLSFCELIQDINERLYAATSLAIKRTKPLPRNISKMVDFELHHLDKNYEDPSEIVALERELSDEEKDHFGAQFSLLDPVFRYRGKFLYLFLKKYVEELAMKCREGNSTYFPDCPVSPIRLGEMTMGCQARRSAIPENLCTFLGQI